MSFDLFKAFILGVVEGLTEFIPVSSTGHLLLIQHFFGFNDEAFGKTFALLIQLGAILAILSVYFARLWKIALGMFDDPAARRFVIGVLVAFLPAMIIGYLARDFIKGTLLNPWIVCFTLISGGAVLLWIDQLTLKPRFTDATAFPLPMYLGIGLAQCLAMVPGVSRSGATIVSAMLFGSDKRAAAEFSFFLAIPTMLGVFVFELFKSRNELTSDNLVLVGVGFVTAFVIALFVVRSLLDYVSRHGFTVFAWWRVIIGTLGLIGLALGR
jgi:undecaprenyl-diphosphatase